MKKKLKDFIKARSKLFKLITIIIGSFLVIVVIPMIINELYKKKYGYITIWEASDTLLFYGSVLTFIGTMFLGFATLYQSHKANGIAEKSTELAKKSYELEQKNLENDLARHIPIFEVNVGEPFIFDDFKCDYCNDYNAESSIVFSEDCVIDQFTRINISIKNLSNELVRQMNSVEAGFSHIGKIDFIRFTPIVQNPCDLLNNEDEIVLCLKFCARHDSGVRSLMEEQFMLYIDFEFYNSLNKKLKMKIELINLKTTIKIISCGISEYV